MMKSTTLGISALAMLFAAGAHAQDYYSPGWGGTWGWGQPVQPGIANFGGLEVGGQFGAAVGATGNVSPTGVGGGVYGGYTLQNGPIVGGIEGDVLGSGISGSGSGGTLNQNVMSSVRVRGGYAFGNILAYGTIGPAWATSTFDQGGFSYDKTMHGYVFGGGVEVMLTRMISARAEFRHYDFGSATYYMPSGPQKLTAGNNLLMVGAGVHF
jgi:outer membrane immunogenic protein